ncbi:hypothetical protein [Bradyrhizobium sp. 170]|uniref:hypothetical protein n=1 Tax=Bradyrhizobium sp. 170 TaxID=2782641 RepID=UPI001FFE5FB5|nr:hypothetical protein [Bradyrhizobium sp. 170]UPK07545.1 hypothetical protein IVB05_19760 [Bradyrhizobium sp. 170]
MQVVAAIAISLASLIFATWGALAGQAFRLEVLYSSPIVVDPSRPPGGPTTAGLILNAQGAFPDGRFAFLASRIASGVRSQVLITDIDQTRPGNAVPLNLKGAQPAGGGGLVSRIFSGPTQTPYVSALAAGMSGEIWLGGYSNAFRDIASAPHSDAYLAKVDASGKPVWEMAYGNGGQRAIWSIGSLATGDVAVFGSDRSGGRVARIGPDGAQLWARPLGNDLGGMIASLPEDRLAVVGFEATGSGQHVTTWILDGTGKQLAHIRIRDSINKSQHSYFGKVFVVTTDDAIYVASNWTGLFDAQPVAIAKISTEGQLLWSTLLPDTIIAVETSARSWKGCSPAVGVTPQGRVLVACALNDKIQLYQLDQSSGAYQESSLPLPDCQIGHPASLFMAIQRDGTTTLSGSRPGSNVAANCTWIGRLTAVQ